MANSRLIEVLESYTGEPETLEAFVKVAAEELGVDWVSNIYDVMADAPASIQEKLAHAYNYNAATIAWNELQEYLLQDTPLDYQSTMERVPVLEHWLSFFGAVGTEALEQLKEKLRAQGEATHQNTSSLDEPFGEKISESLLVMPQSDAEMPQSESELSEDIEHIFSDDGGELPQNMQEVSAYFDNAQQEIGTTQPPEIREEQVPNIPQPIQTDDVSFATENIQNNVNVNNPVVLNEQTDVNVAPETYRSDVFDPIAVSEPAQNNTPLQMESEESWRVHKIFRQIDFVVNIESWISFLCLDLGYTDFYTYRYYGFLVDVLEKTVEELKDLLKQTKLYDIINAQRSGGVQYLQNKLLAYQKQANEAREMLSDYIPLVREDLSVDDLKKRLGGMDFSEEKEYLGPAPDGFEIIDDPYENMNEDDLKKEYEKIEAEGNLSTDAMVNRDVSVAQSQMVQEKPMADVKNTSQTSQNGVQRKMSFTFGVKPTQRPMQTDETTS